MDLSQEKSDIIVESDMKRESTEDEEPLHKNFDFAQSVHNPELTSALENEEREVAQVMEPKSVSALKSVERTSTRKRKYLFKIDNVAPKRCKKHYFINTMATKPRKLKVAKVVEKHQKEQKPNPTIAVQSRKHKLHCVKTDCDGNLYLMHRLHAKSDLFFNDEKKYNYETFKKLDLAFHIVDEIALEGLDGITLEAFWKRLKNVFPNNMNKAMADRIWRVICNNKKINFYILKEPREKLVFFDRCKYLDIDSGMFLEPFIEFKDIYPMSSVNGVDVRGSCTTFNTRKENNGVRKFSMDKAIKLYDQKLVFVADQTLRNKALINEEADPNIELQDVEYCMLEKIGRSRDQGEFTQGKMSLINDSKKVYHNRKVLAQHFLVVIQNFSIKSFALQQNMSGGLIQLSRFYHKRKTKHIAIMERIAHILRTKPNCQMEFTEFRKIFGRNISIVKLMKSAEFRRFFKIMIFPYRKFYPNATKQEYLHKNKMKERQVRVLRMLDPCANVTVLMEGKETKEVPREKPDGSPGRKLINYEYLRDIFLYILSSGNVGVTIQEIHNYFKTDFYSVRMVVRKLLLRNVVKSIKVDLGRQQSLKFFAKRVDINTCPKNYELTEETLARVLQGYNDKTPDDFQPEPESSVSLIPIQTEFKLNFEPFCCTAFLTETVDPYSEELTIYDIVNKGRDKLLLIESNLFAHYISEWDDFLLKRDDFAKGIELFLHGFGKVIYDFLNTIRIGNGIKVDNQIVFSVKNISPETRISRRFNTHRIFKIAKNYSNPHSNNYHLDFISKMYIFEAMFNSSRGTNRCIEKLEAIFERLMISEGKTRKMKCEELVVKPEVNIEVEVTSNVIMEKFMGLSPALEWVAQEEGITIEIFSSTKQERVMMTGNMFVTDDVSLTSRYINRANLILKAVYSEKIVQDVRTLYKDVLKEENIEGYDKKACKKSIVTIVARLVEGGYIKCYKVVMSGKNMTRTQSFVCVHEVESHHPFIRSSIEQMKLKFYVGSSNTQKTITIKKKSESPFSSSDVKESITELKQLTNFKTELNLKFDRAKGKIYGYTPKFVRMRVLHEHLFYVIRHLKESEPLTHRQIFEICKSLKIKVSHTDITEMPAVYRNEVSWKMFIPALPQHTNWPKGWALACDIVLRMPLSVFVKLYNITYEVPELESYLKHPIKRHYLVKYLPVSVRNILLYRRKYFHSIYETICHLCYIGLVQLGPRNFKEKDQLFMYVNSKGTLYDTCTSQPGYNTIEEKKYKKLSIDFKLGSDVEIYWSEMLRICMNTPLGKRKILDGQLVTIEECASKPAMLASVSPRTFEEAVQKDTGHIPGDGRGSAGLDSSLWSFLKRNWVWNTPPPKPYELQSAAVAVKKDTYDVILPEPIQYDLVAKGGPPERKVYLKTGKSKKKVSTKMSSLVKTLSKKKFVRKIVAPRKKKVRAYCDAIDRQIMKKNPGIKVEWSEEENQLLRYCRIASVFLCPVFKKQFVPYNILRDVLHSIHPKSKNKTARAIQRRIYVMLTNDETIKIMETNIENLLNSDTISKYFEQIHNRYKDGVKINDTHIHILFAYLMSYICKHKKEVELLLLGFFASFDFFSDANIRDFENLLQSCDDTNSTIYTNPKTVEDVTKDTIKSVTHCSMACRENSVGWTFHLSRIYKRFPDDLIRTSVANLKKDQFFVQNKSFEGKNLDSGFPAPIKFSYVYNMMKTTSYTIEMYRQAYKNFTAMIAGRTDPGVVSFINSNELGSFWENTSIIFDIPELGIILNPEIEDHSDVIEELAQRLRIYLEQIYNKNTGTKTKTMLSGDTESTRQEKNLEEIKDEVRHLIFRVPYLLEGNLETYFKKMLDCCSNLEIGHYILLMVGDLKNFAQNTITMENLKAFINSIEDEGVDDAEQLVKSLSKVVFAIQNMHQHQHDSSVSEGLDDAFKLWETEIWDEVRTRSNEDSNNGCKTLFSKYCASGMESCLKRAQEGDFPSLDEIKQGMMAEFENADDRKIPHVTDLITLLDEDRFPELDTDVETVEQMKEHFIMQYPKLDEFIIEDLGLMLEMDVTRKIMEDTKIEEIKKMTENVVQQPQISRILEYVEANNGSALDAKITMHLLDFIKGKKELGVPAKELKDKFMNLISLDMLKLMQFLCEINVVLRAGISSIVYVYHEFQTEWLTETFMLTQKEKEIFEAKQKQEIKKNISSMMGDSMQPLEPRKVQLKPWNQLDGSIHDELFREWLCLILSRCIDFPNIPFSALCEQFQYVKPVDIFCLLEVLQELGCVKICVLISVENSLLTERCLVSECQATCLDSFENIFVKPTNVASLCFGSFVEKNPVEYL